MESFDTDRWLKRFRSGAVSHARVNLSWTGACFTRYLRDDEYHYAFGDRTGLVSRRQQLLPFDLHEGFKPQDPTDYEERVTERVGGKRVEKRETMGEAIRILQALRHEHEDLEEYAFAGERKCFVEIASTQTEPDKILSLDACCVSSLPRATLFDFGVSWQLPLPMQK